MNIIISKTPLRITLGGGGTDLPSFYEKENGFWISGAINKFIYVIIKDRFEKPLRVAYSALEYVDHPNQLEHPVIRTVLNQFNIDSHIEIATFADLPARTGLGSSGCFTVGLLNALYYYKGKNVSPKELAEEAFRLEHHTLGRPSGKQDPYVAAFGGVRNYFIDTKGKVTVSHSLNALQMEELLNHLSLFFVEQRSSSADTFLRLTTFEDLQKVKEIGKRSWEAIEREDFLECGRLMNEYWKIKLNLSPNHIYYDNLIQVAKKYGAISGKLIGAGGGGFILLCSSHKHEFEKKFIGLGVADSLKLQHISFKFHEQGNEVMEI